MISVCPPQPFGCIQTVDNMAHRLLRVRDVCDFTGDGSTTLYAKIKQGVMTPPIKLTQRASAWPEDELIAINRARIAGKGDEQIKELVKQLVAARTSASQPDRSAA